MIHDRTVTLRILQEEQQHRNTQSNLVPLLGIRRDIDHPKSEPNNEHVEQLPRFYKASHPFLERKLKVIDQK